MHLVRRYEVRDYRDPDARNAQPAYRYDSASERQPGFWNHVHNAANFLWTGLFVGLTLYNVFIIGGWISDYYAKKRMERARHSVPWKRSRAREWGRPSGEQGDC